jgi:hypothetical protein
MSKAERKEVKEFQAEMWRFHEDVAMDRASWDSA